MPTHRQCNVWFENWVKNLEWKKGNTGISGGVVSHRLASNNKAYIKMSSDIARPNYTSHWTCRRLILELKEYPVLCWDQYKVWAFVTYRNISYVRIEARLFSHKVARAIFWDWAKPDLWQFVAGHHFSFLLQPTSLLPLYPQFLVTSFESKPENRSNQQYLASNRTSDFLAHVIPDDFVTRNCHYVHSTLFLFGP